MSDEEKGLEKVFGDWFENLPKVQGFVFDGNHLRVKRLDHKTLQAWKSNKPWFTVEIVGWDFRLQLHELGGRYLWIPSRSINLHEDRRIIEGLFTDLPQEAHSLKVAA